MEKNIKITIFSLIVVISAICIIAVYNNNTSKNTFKKDGILYALTVDGTSATSFPSKGMYKVTISCENADCKWLYDDWKLSIENITGDVSCDIDFTTIEKTYLNSYITSLAGTTQGTGEVVSETATKDNSTFTVGATLTQSGYSNITNDLTYAYTFDSSANTWTSTNHTDSATATLTFTVATTGFYQVCYKQSSEKNCDYAIFYKDGTQVKSLKGISNTSYECYYLGQLTTSNVIKVTYQKDSSSSSGDDQVVFYLQSGTYNEDIQTVSAGIRYEGKNPNNYVWFNNEYWRIIGVFDSASHGQSSNLVKLIRAELLDGLAWHKSNTNDWTAASLRSLLNGNYYNATDGTSSGYCYGYSTTATGNCDYTKKGIQDGYRGMIANVTWYLGGYSDSDATAEAFYGYERGTTIYSGRPTSTTGYIGLMYPSDYGYSVLSTSCGRTTQLSSYNSSTCAGASWLYGKGLEWTLSPSSFYSDYVFLVSYFGYLYYLSASSGYGVRPVLYLDSSVYKISGSGTLSDPYIIGM